MSNNTNLAMEQSFRAVAQALDRFPESEAADFLARLVLVLAHEIKDGERFEKAVQRASQAAPSGVQA